MQYNVIDSTRTGYNVSAHIKTIIQIIFSIRLPDNFFVLQSTSGTGPDLPLDRVGRLQTTAQNFNTYLKMYAK